MKVSFITSGHLPKDDRTYYHQARTLTESGFKTEIISSKLLFSGVENGVAFNCFDDDNLTKKEKIERFVQLLNNSKPDIIICQEPLTVFAATKFKKQAVTKPEIVYDITEWFPSKKFLARYGFVLKTVNFIKILIFNLITASKADAYIFGEWYKSRPYRILFPRKKFIYSGYYPDLKYITLKEPALGDNHLQLSYSGKLSIEKGFGNFLNAIFKLTEKRPGLKISIKVIGWYDNKKEQADFENTIDSLPENVKFTFYPMQEFFTFIKLISDTDIFLDLRSDDLENRHCLPIKLFYYAALKRPVIYTTLKAIRKEVEISKFGYLVNPEDANNISDLILNYIDNKSLYLQHCSAARKLAETRYNWSTIKDDFIEFIYNLNKK